MKRNHLELTTKCNNLSNMRNEFIQQKKLFGNMTKKSENQKGINSTLRSTGFSGFSPVASISHSNKFN